MASTQPRASRNRNHNGNRGRRGPQARDRAAPEGVRLQKVLAEAGVAARRKCEQLIEEGRVRVNGEVKRELPLFVDPAGDRIEVDGEAIARPPTRAGTGKVRHRYLMLHKPKNVVSTTEDPEGRPTVLDLVHTAGDRLYPVGRLDADSTGFILLTDDGELTQGLTHPSREVPKKYVVSVRGKVSAEDVERLRKGLILAKRRGGGGRKASVEGVRKIKEETDRQRGDRTLLEVTLIEGQNREIRRVMARLGYKVRRLKRMAIGPVKMKGVGPGEYRPLTSGEVRALKRAAGLTGEDPAAASRP